MPINPDAVGFTSQPRESTWDSKDCLLYALGVGAGVADPTGFELEFTTENTAGVTQRVLPTFPVVVAGGAGTMDVLGDFDRAMLVHGRQAVELAGPIPVSGRVSATTEIAGIWDKGAAAVVDTVTTAVDAVTGEARWTTKGSMFIRGAGGWGGERGPSARSAPPERAPDDTVAYTTRPDQALLYRLNGDRNPLHSDPSFAARGGFDTPILHGLCTYGFTGRALLHTLCGSDPARFVSMSGRFSQPVLPGQTLTVSIWRTGPGRAAFLTASDTGTVIDGGELAYVAD
jgi:acyl dehydratase